MLAGETDHLQSWRRLVRFISEDGKQYYGEPEDHNVDSESALYTLVKTLTYGISVGLAVAAKKQVKVKVLATETALDHNAQFNGDVKTIKQVCN